MASSTYLEDVFVELTQYIDRGDININPQDVSAISSFYHYITSSLPLTQSQGNLIIKFLNKYKSQALKVDFDYSSSLDDPRWKTPFRVIDLSKKIWVENDDEKITWVCLKFPYQLKKEFDSEFDSDNHHSIWDADRKIRKIILYKCNLIQLHEFAVNHNFEIDDTFLIALGDVEEIWQHQDDILPRSEKINDAVCLLNCSQETKSWFENHRTKHYETDLLLAKSMGYIFNGQPDNVLEFISASKENTFWMKDIVGFLNLCDSIQGKICIILDRAGKSLEWLEMFELALVQSTLPRSTVRVCFRAEKDQEPQINQWIKDHGFGGKVGDAKVLIFNHKPAKWLFKEQENVKIIATNNIYSPTSMIARDWFSSHPCVIYIGDIKPTMSKDHKIVDL